MLAQLSCALPTPLAEDRFLPSCATQSGHAEARAGGGIEGYHTGCNLDVLSAFTGHALFDVAPVFK